MNVRASRLRSLIALLLIVLASFVFLLRLVDTQIVSAPGLNEDAKNKRAVPVSIPSVRGDIVDRNDRVLATTDERYDVQLSPKNTKVHSARFTRVDSDSDTGTVWVTSEQAFTEIGEITGQSADEIQKIVDDALEDNPNSDFAYVKRSIDLVQLNALKALEIPWLTFEVQHKRTYPNGAVGGNLIGFSNVDGLPQAGVEMSQDTCLTGVDGVESFERGADGVALPGSVVVTEQAVNGGTVKLTIDLDLQWEAQQAVNEQVQKVGAEWGYVVVLDANTGELVAVAEDGSVDPNDVDASDASKREARSFTSPYEPGSTFKTFTAAALINEGLASPTTQNLTPDSIEPEPGVRFGDSYSHAPMPWTLTGILKESSNVGIATLGSALSDQQRYEYLQKFGIGVSTSAGMPLEDSGLLHSTDQWDRQTSYNTMFGQGLSSTIVQTASAYQALANDGERIPPTLVDSCTDAGGEVSEPDHGDPVQVVTPETARTVLDMLETVANEAWWADKVTVPGYRIGVKTGTAEQSDGQGGYRSDYVSSFAGIFPIDDPQYVVVSSIAFPSAGDGTSAAADTFRDTVEATIRTFHVPPSSGSYAPLQTEY